MWVVQVFVRFKRGFGAGPFAVLFPRGSDFRV